MLSRVICCEVSMLAWSLTVNQEIVGSNPALTARINKVVDQLPGFCTSRRLSYAIFRYYMRWCR
jgi:hypothetical protein